MKSNERIYVKSYDCASTEDDWEHGESLNPSSSWTSEDTRFKNAENGYATAAEALEAVCENEFFDFVKENWIAFGKDYGDEFGRFDGDVLVNNDNAQASPSEIEKWKKGEQKLWNCHVHVYLEIRTVREFTLEDAEAF